MKWPKLDEKCASNSSNNKNPNYLFNHYGMTLVELMVAVGMSSIILLAAGSVMVFVADSFSKIVDKDEAETSIATAAYHLRTIATQAVNLYGIDADAELEGIDAAADAASTGNMTRGQILRSANTATTFNNIMGNANHRSRMVELAVFYREAALTGNSQYRPTGIFFKTPWHRCPPDIQDANDQIYGGTRDQCSGQLIIISGTADTYDLGTAGNPLFSAVAVGQSQRLVATNALVDVFPRLTTISLATDTQAGADTYAWQAKFTLTARYFLSGDPRKFNYVSNAGEGQFKEVSMIVDLGFRNNFIGPNPTANYTEPVRPHGGAYYFPFVSQLRGI